MGRYIITFTDPDANAFALQSFERGKRRSDSAFSLEFHERDVSQKFIQELVVTLEQRLNCTVESVVREATVLEEVPRLE